MLSIINIKNMPLIPSVEKNQVSGAALEVYEEFEKSGPIPEWIKVMENNPKIMEACAGLFHAIMGPGTLDSKLKWEVGYIISSMLRCKFCLGTASNMLKNLGFMEDTIHNLEERKNISDEEEKILELAEEITKTGNIENPEIFENIQSRFNNAQIVELISVIGFFNYINRFNNALDII